MSSFNRPVGFVRAVALGCLAIIAGCSKLHPPLLNNQRPTVEFTLAPRSAAPADRAFYAYRMFWSGDDPDGRIDHFEYSIDPGSGDSTWVSTTRSEEVMFFRSPVPDGGGGAVPTSSGFHVLALRSVDNQGARSAVRTRAFYSWTVAPSVSIVRPQPSGLLAAQVAPSATIQWQGQDPDGQRTQRPVSYRFRLFSLQDPLSSWMLSHPDSLRSIAANSGFAGWDSTGADSTFAHYTNMAPDGRWLFVVVAFDEAGAYSPVFSLDENMLRMTVTPAAERGPRIHIFNEFVDFTYDSGGYTRDPLRWIRLEAPAGTTLRFNWEAFASPGASIQNYRWAVDLADLQDRTPRSDEVTDILHWSQPSPLVTSAVIAGLPPGAHYIYIEATDNNGFASLGVVEATLVTTPFDRELLVVDDTRYEPDKSIGSSCPDSYKSRWPSAAELDTFLYARGGMPWRCVVDPAAAPRTIPGVLAGYSYDTLGTRRGFEVPTLGARLRDIGRYRHVLWLVDGLGALNTEVASASLPITVLRYMSARARASTLAAYTIAGGRVWLMGGGAGTASIQGFNVDRNDTPGGPVYSNSVGELVPGRLMYDGAHWRSAFTVGRRNLTLRRSVRAEAMAAQPWSHPDAWGGPDVRSPDYLRLPAEMRHRDPATDPLPPTRSASQPLYYPEGFATELLIEPNDITEDVDPSAEVVRIAAVLDTLMEAEAAGLARSPAPIMTRYHGREANQFVFSGFAPWDFRRDDCITLFDFVLQDLWGLQRRPVDRGTIPVAGARAAARPVAVTPAQRQLRTPVHRE